MVRAVIIGVSNYYIDTKIDTKSSLEFCKNDIELFKLTIKQRLSITDDNILLCGTKGDVFMSEFINRFSSFLKDTSPDDTLIFYFSGHGLVEKKESYLKFSDKFLKTQELINLFEKSQIKSKIMFIDACESGGLRVDNAFQLGVEENIRNYAGKGYVVFTSSRANQYSWKHMDKNISVFTYFLSSAFTNNSIIKNGRINLYELCKLTRLYIEVYSRKHPKYKQDTTYSSKIFGTLFFEVTNYIPYIPNDFYREMEKYIIYKVTPVHHSFTKRYDVRIILKTAVTLTEIQEISKEINNILCKADVYQNKIAEKRFKGENTNIIWCFYGYNVEDIERCNFICKTTWVDDKQDKNNWYKTNSKDTFFIKGTHFKVFSTYDFMKKFNKDNTGEKEMLIKTTREILNKSIKCAERVFYEYAKLKNKAISEEQFICKIKPILNEIDTLYFKSTELNIPPLEIKEWSQKFDSLIATIHNLTIYYGKHGLKNRSYENRIACVEMTIKDYHNLLDEFGQIDNI